MCRRISRALSQTLVCGDAVLIRLTHVSFADMCFLLLTNMLFISLLSPILLTDCDEFVFKKYKVCESLDQKSTPFGVPVNVIFILLIIYPRILIRSFLGSTREHYATAV